MPGRIQLVSFQLLFFLQSTAQLGSVGWSFSNLEEKPHRINSLSLYRIMVHPILVFLGTMYIVIAKIHDLISSSFIIFSILKTVSIYNYNIWKQVSKKAHNYSFEIQQLDACSQNVMFSIDLRDKKKQTACNYLLMISFELEQQQ